MADIIRVLIVDDLPETRENVRKLLQFESDIEVVGQAGTGEEAVEMAQQYQPDIILMDINMPGIDGIGASQKISELAPMVQIIIMSVQSDPNYLRRAMMAGARDFLTKPFGGDELVAAIRRVHDKRPTVRVAASSTQQSPASGAVAPVESYPEGKIVTVFSPKGGNGCTTVALNVAVTMAKRGHRTILVDGSLQFGDAAVMLDMKSVTTIADLSDRGEIDADLINSVVQVHKSNLNVLLAPPRPEMADDINAEHIKNLLENLKTIYEFVIVDTPSYLDEKALTMLDLADRIVLITQQNLPSLKNISRFFDLAEKLEYSTDKVLLVVNRAMNTKQKISIKDISDILKRSILMSIPADDLVVEASANHGVPIVLGKGQKQPSSMALIKLADYLRRDLLDSKATSAKSNGKEAEKSSGGLFGKLFNKAGG